jgi:fatty acid synthase
VKGPSFQFDLENPSPILRKILEDDLVHNVLSETGVHGFYAHHEYFPEKEVTGRTDSYYLDTGAEGETTFRWHQSPPTCWDDSCEKEHKKIQASHAILNLGELLLSTGKIGRYLIEDPENPRDVFAVEFSGTDSKGKRVIGISERSGLATSVCIEKHNFLVELPSNVSLAEGATMPMAYSTVSKAYTYNLQPGIVIFALFQYNFFHYRLFMLL